MGFANGYHKQSNRGCRQPCSRPHGWGQVKETSKLWALLQFTGCNVAEHQLDHLSTSIALGQGIKCTMACRSSNDRFGLEDGVQQTPMERSVSHPHLQHLLNSARGAQANGSLAYCSVCLWTPSSLISGTCLSLHHLCDSLHLFDRGTCHWSSLLSETWCVRRPWARQRGSCLPAHP